jgi:hypothetical protein
MPPKSDDPNAYSGWSQTQIDFFKVEFNSGASYHMIANRMNAEFGMSLTRNSISSICFRKGYKRVEDARAKSIKPPRHRIPGAAKATPVSPATMLKMENQRAELGIRDMSADEKATMKLLDMPIWRTSNAVRPLLSLNEDACRWLFECDDGSNGFCLNERGHGSYCLAHASIAYRPVSEYKRAY